MRTSLKKYFWKGEGRRKCIGKPRKMDMKFNGEFERNGNKNLEEENIGQRILRFLLLNRLWSSKVHKTLLFFFTFIAAILV